MSINKFIFGIQNNSDNLYFVIENQLYFICSYLYLFFFFSLCIQYCNFLYPRFEKVGGGGGGYTGLHLSVVPSVLP